MAERKRLSGTDTITYEGFFDMKHVSRVMNTWFAQRGYERHEALNAHNVQESGHEMSLYIIFIKKISDYARVDIEIFITVNRLQQVDVEIDGHKRRMHKGEVSMNFDCFLITDYEHKWENQPTMYFLRTIFDKFVFKLYLHQFEDEAKRDCKDSMHEIKSFLNTQQFLTTT